MNILIPHLWLLDHLDTDADPVKIRETLSLCGPSVERIEMIENEPVYDIEVTTNRVDSMSVRGIAREAATILPEFGITAKLKNLPFNSEEIESSLNGNEAVGLDIQNDPTLCHRILAVTMSVSQVGPSPDWLQKRLVQVGQRPINNLIDITNYVMWELGHPIHVFDLDRLTEKKIIVRQAKPGENLVTLDGKKHTTKGGEVVFDDGTGTIIDLPGIMGTENSMVTDETKNILVWVESVPAKLIRQASMGLAIRTQAAVLNEKNVDPNLGKDTILRAVDLYTQLAGGKATSNLYDEYPVKPEIKSTNLSHQTIELYLGLSIEPEKVSRILTDLGCTVELNVSEYHVTPPSFRVHDLVITQDYIEEIARIYGYHNLPSVLMETPIPDVSTNIDHNFEYNLKQRLADWGLHEVYTYSLISSRMAVDSGISIDEHIKLKNPLNEDLVYLRRSIIPSHNEVFLNNKSITSLSIFELANVYVVPSKTEPSLPTEQLHLVISSTESYLHLKGIVESLLQSLRIEDCVFEPDSNQVNGFKPDRVAEIKVKEMTLGFIGESTFGFYSAQIDFDTLYSSSKPHPMYQPLSQTSPVIEDMTFTLPGKTHIGKVIQTISSCDPLIESVDLKDTFNQNYTFAITFIDRESQLTTERVEPIRKQIAETLRSEFSAQLVGKI